MQSRAAVRLPAELGQGRDAGESPLPRRMATAAVYPPARTSIEPVTMRASSAQRYRIAASSSGLPIRPTWNTDVSCSGVMPLAVQKAPDHVQGCRSRRRRSRSR
jgi:hypothetical protein